MLALYLHTRYDDDVYLHESTEVLEGVEVAEELGDVVGDLLLSLILDL